ncbi:MAG TPA: hypothetical protein VFS20_01555, partial [Longimicrobium sp.]|nr:hypothetical protein [Longimicrobium sp.]
CGAPRGSSPERQVREYSLENTPRSGQPQPAMSPPPSAARPQRPEKKSRFGRNVFVLLLVSFFGWIGWSNRTRHVDAQVTAKEWERSVQVEAYRTVQEEDWSLPQGARQVRSYRAIRDYRRVLDHYETRYHTETYQEPIYRREPIWDTKYVYRIKRWVPDTLLREHGDTTAPVWPRTEPDDTTRDGEKKQRYVMTFRDGEGDSYTTEVPLEQFTGHRVGERVPLKVNGTRAQIDTARID